MSRQAASDSGLLPEHWRVRVHARALKPICLAGLASCPSACCRTGCRVEGTDLNLQRNVPSPDQISFAIENLLYSRPLAYANLPRVIEAALASGAREIKVKLLL